MKKYNKIPQVRILVYPGKDIRLFQYLFLFLIILITSALFAQKKSDMVLIPSGFYEPLFKSDTDQKIKIEKFYLDTYPVTNEEFLEFVKENPQWSRSKVKKIFADESYLRKWKSDFELGENVNPKAPVTNVSWFAAKAYAEWKGKRLPTVAEWEYVI